MTRLPTVAGGLALVVVLLAGCGGGDDRATVEANLRHYLATIDPEGGFFPSGAGPPRVKDNGCKDLHRKVDPGAALSPPGFPKFKKGESFAAWMCVVSFRNLTLPVGVLVDDRDEVVWAEPGSSNRPGTTPSPPRTYTG